MTGCYPERYSSTFQALCIRDPEGQRVHWYLSELGRIRHHQRVIERLAQ